MKKIIMTIGLLSVLFFAAGYTATAGVNGVNSDDKGLGDSHIIEQIGEGSNYNLVDNGEVVIRRGNKLTIGIYLYLETTSFTIDFTQPPYNQLPIDTETLDITSEPQNGNAEINEDKITYEPELNYIGTDNFTITADNEEEDDTDDYEIVVNIYMGAASNPSDFSISINYTTDSDNPEVVGITWDGAYNATAYSLYYRDPSSTDYSPVSNYENVARSEFIKIDFDDLISSTNGTRIYLAMKASKYNKPDEYLFSFELPINPSTGLLETDYLASDYSNILILDPPGQNTRNLPPDTPTITSVRVSGPDQALVTFTGNENMLDIKNHVIKYWLDDGIATAEDESTPSITVPGNPGSATISDLLDKTRYIIRITAYDQYDKQANSNQYAFLMEESITSLQNPLLFEGGCFISNIRNMDSDIYKGLLAISMILFLLFFITRRKGLLKIFFPTLLCVLIFHNTALSKEKNTIGIKGGVVATSDETLELSYGETGKSVILFYNRDLFYNFSAELEVGYISRTGYEITESGETTEIDTTLTLVPIASSLKYNLEITPLISTYIGGGLDFWYYKEENEYKEFEAFDDEKYGVGGYHGKIGVYLKTADKDIKKEVGVILEVVYSKIDRLGENELDLGGIHYNFGIFYMF